MEQHNRVYIPVNQISNDGVYLIATSKTTTKPLVTISAPIGHQVWLEEHKDKVIITMEELAQLWDAARETQSKETKLEDYLEQKAKYLIQE